LVLAHFDHRARGRASSGDRKFVERLSEELGIPLDVGEAPLRRGTGTPGWGRKDRKAPPGFEGRARAARYAFLIGQKKARGAEMILVGHTADDQVETVLMRVLEGAGISGLKGIPRKTADGIERPLLDTWREDIDKYLHKHKIPYRVDKSNFDTRFERNWVRHVLIPLLEKRYGKSVKKRIFALGERFREIDEFLAEAARKWMKRNLRRNRKVTRKGFRPVEPLNLPRKPYSGLPPAARKKVLQLLCFERIGIQPNERLLESMDRLIVGSDASGRLNIGKSWLLRCRYDRAILEIEKTGASNGKRKRSVLRMNGPGRYEIAEGKGGEAFRAGHPTEILWEERGKIPAGNLKRLAIGERTAVFDPGAIFIPLTVRPLRAGDRILPFGLDAEKKVKEILIDRKVPQEERWGRPVVCDAEGRILWIPGVVRSAHAPVTGKTRRTAVFRLALSR
jgi:tRNA(Ile)-lysidine synthase